MRDAPHSLKDQHVAHHRERSWRREQSGNGVDVLIVEGNVPLARLWQRHLERHSARVVVVATEAEALTTLRERVFQVIVLDLILEEGSAFAVADFANFRQPDCRVIFVTNSSFFSDGSIFQLCSNACAFLPVATAPEDLAAMVEHYGMDVRRP